MQFAILFILAFLVGLVIYLLSRKWMLAVGLPMVLFTINAVLTYETLQSLVFTLVFGLTIVFFASLLAAYVVQMRTVEPEDADRINEQD